MSLGGPAIEEKLRRRTEKLHQLEDRVSSLTEAVKVLSAQSEQQKATIASLRRDRRWPSETEMAKYLSDVGTWPVSEERRRAVFTAMMDRDEARRDATAARAERDRAVARHDGMVSSLRELQVDTQRAQRKTDSALEAIAELGRIDRDNVELIRRLGEAWREMEDCHYWLNKSRTDEDYELYSEKTSEAEKKYDEALQAVLKLVGADRKPWDTP